MRFEINRSGLPGLNPLLIGAQCEQVNSASVPLAPGLNPLLIGAQCEPARFGCFLQDASLNPLLIGAQCERSDDVELEASLGLNPLLIGAQCEPSTRSKDKGILLSQSPFDRGSV